MEELPLKGYSELFISASADRYSTQLTKLDSLTFCKTYYDNAKGKSFKDTFKWEGQAFVRINSEQVQ